MSQYISKAERERSKRATEFWLKVAQRESVGFLAAMAEVGDI